MSAFEEMSAVISVGVLIVLTGLLMIWLSVRMQRGRLSRNSIAGVRTRSTMRSEDAFRIANKAAAPFTAAGGVFFMAGGVATAILRPATAGPALLAAVLAGAVACVTGGVLGVRAIR
jgi:SdpI/YfhL protein family